MSGRKYMVKRHRGQEKEDNQLNYKSIAVVVYMGEDAPISSYGRERYNKLKKVWMIF